MFPLFPNKNSAISATPTSCSWARRRSAEIFRFLRRPLSARFKIVRRGPNGTSISARFAWGRALAHTMAHETKKLVGDRLLTDTVQAMDGTGSAPVGIPDVAGQFRRLVNDTLYALDLDEPLKRDLARRLYDLMGYEGIRCAGHYAKLVLQVASRDKARPGFAATRAVIANAYKVIAIKDEFYVAHLLTREEKYERDAARFRIDASRGDRLSYRHFHQPEVALFGRRFRRNLMTRDWQLRLLSRLSFLRRWWPRWHEKETHFRDWYLSLARSFEAVTPDEYDLWVTILQTPDSVRGYRDIALHPDGPGAPARRRALAIPAEVRA